MMIDSLPIFSKISVGLVIFIPQPSYCNNKELLRQLAYKSRFWGLFFDLATQFPRIFRSVAKILIKQIKLSFEKRKKTQHI